MKTATQILVLDLQNLELKNSKCRPSMVILLRKMQWFVEVVTVDRSWKNLLDCRNYFHLMMM